MTIKKLKHMTCVFCITSLGFLCASCATPYKKDGLMGGYSDLNLGNNRFVVSFKGNAFTSRDTVGKYLLRRSAELTVQHEKRYFTILSSANDTRVSSYYVPRTTSTYGSGSVYGNNFNYQQNSTVSGGYRGRIYKPGERIIIQLSNRDKPGSLDAKDILSNFKTA